MTESYIKGGPGGTTFAGPDAVRLFQATAIKGALGLLERGIQPTRGYTMRRALEAASTFTGKPYKRGQAAQARADLETWCNAMRAALPVVREDAQ